MDRADTDAEMVLYANVGRTDARLLLYGNFDIVVDTIWYVVVIKKWTNQEMVDELDRHIGEYVKISKIFLFLEEKKGNITWRSYGLALIVYTRNCIIRFTRLGFIKEMYMNVCGSTKQILKSVGFSCRKGC